MSIFEFEKPPKIFCSIDVFVTTDYDLFFKDTSINRPVVAPNVNGISTLMSQHGFLLDGMLLCDEVTVEIDGMAVKKNRVLDGQNRLEAARKAGAPIMYRVIQEEKALILDADGHWSEGMVAPETVIQVLNSQSSKWNGDNHIHFHADTNDDMAFLEKLKKRCGFTIPLVNQILKMAGAVAANNEVNASSVKNNTVALTLSPEIESAIEEILEKIKQFYNAFPLPVAQKLMNEALTKALVELLPVPKFQFEKLLFAVEDKPEFLQRISGRMPNIKQLVELHNSPITPGKKRIFLDETYKGRDPSRLFN